MKKTLLEEDKIAAAIRLMPSRSFTALDFSEVFKTFYPAAWQRLAARFGSPWIAVFKKKERIRP